MNRRQFLSRLVAVAAIGIGAKQLLPKPEPVRWIDVTKINPQILAQLQRGQYYEMIPIQSDGHNWHVIGEATRYIPKGQYGWVQL